MENNIVKWKFYLGTVFFMLIMFSSFLKIIIVENLLSVWRCECQIRIFAFMNAFKMRL